MIVGWRAGVEFRPFRRSGEQRSSGGEALVSAMPVRLRRERMSRAEAEKHTET